MMRKRYIVILVSIFVLGKVFAQDSHFSQYYSTPIYTSPSLAGASEQSRLIINYRNQWPSLPNAYTNYSMSFDHYLADYKSGIGLVVVSSQEGGVYNTTNAGLVYSYTISVNREFKIRPGMKAGYYFRNIDYNSIQFADQITRSSSTTIEILNEDFKRHYDFTSSVLAYTSFYWLGITGDHMLAINQQFKNDPTYPSLKLLVYGGGKFKLFESVLSKIDRTFSASFLYKQQGDFMQLDFGTYYEEEPFRIGLFFRGVPVFKGSNNLNAITILAGYTYRNAKVNYSYDISTSRLLAATGGAHEIALLYYFKLGWTGKKTRLGAVPCPHF